ncbi:MAG: hypothetical protein ACR2NA_04870, partial [Solirubrobacterales bacterium]
TSTLSIARPALMRPTISDPARAFEAFGVRFAVKAPVDDETLRAYLPPASRRVRQRSDDRIFAVVPTGVARYDVFDGPTPSGLGQLLPAALSTVAADLRRTLAEQSPALLFVHAGVVGLAGRAVVLPGRSEAGKSSLVAALVQAGTEYLSDEYAPLDVHGLAHPYPQDIRLRVDGDSVAVAPRQLGGSTAVGLVPVGAIVVTSFYRPSTRWRRRSATAAEGAILLLQHAPAARVRPDHALAAVAAATRDAIVLVGRRGDAAVAATSIMRKLAAAWA